MFQLLLLAGITLALFSTLMAPLSVGAGTDLDS
jgi:hypothetical protein